MSYIGDMTNVLLDEMDDIEKLLKYSDDLAYGIWFSGKAAKRIEELEDDFDYYIEVTEIRKKSMNDKVAAATYKYLKDRIIYLKELEFRVKIE